MINNLFSLRFWIAPLLGAGIVAVIVTLPIYLVAPTIHDTAIQVVFWPVALILGLYMANPRNPGGEYFHCPKCGKALRNNKGATVCHHCGFDTVAMAYARR